MIFNIVAIMFPIAGIIISIALGNFMAAVWATSAAAWTIVSLRERTRNTTKRKQVVWKVSNDTV